MEDIFSFNSKLCSNFEFMASSIDSQTSNTNYAGFEFLLSYKISWPLEILVSPDNIVQFYFINQGTTRYSTW